VHSVEQFEESALNPRAAGPTGSRKKNSYTFREPAMNRANMDALEPRRLMAAGDFDPSFSGDGQFTFNLTGDPFEVTDTAIDADGRTILAGNKGQTIAVARLNPDGTPDPSFGSGGLFLSTLQGDVSSVAVQGDYKIVLGVNHAIVLDMQVRRLLANGSGFDPTFGANGLATLTDRWDDSYVTDVMVQRDGKILVAGAVDNGTLFAAYDVAVVRYNADGLVDMPFGGGDGVSEHGFGSDFEQVESLTIDYNGNPSTNPMYGSIVAAVSSLDQTDRFRVLRLRPDGTPDPTFDGDGLLTSVNLSTAVHERISGVVVQPGGKIVASGSAGAADPTFQDFLVARYNANGSLDTAFGLASGVTQQSIGATDTAGPITTGYLGGLLVAGTVDGKLAVMALRDNGQLDTRFSGDGIVTTQIQLQNPGVGVRSPGLAVTTNLIAPIRRLVVAGGRGHVARFIDVGSVVSVGTFAPNAYEQNQQSTTFVVGRTQVLPFVERVFIGTSGAATPPLRISPRDYNGTGITFGNGTTSTTYVDIAANTSFTTVTITPVDDTTVEGDEPAIFTAAPNNAYDVSSTPSATLMIRDNDMVGGPTVAAAQFVYQTAPQRAEFRFTQDVAGSISIADFQVTGPAGMPSPTFSYNPVTNTATLSFGSVLPDGDYSARAIAAGITNAQGQPMLADHVLSFFFLQGDANHDRNVNLTDFNILATNFGQTPRTFAQGDFTYDGTVNLNDFNVLAARFGQALAAPAAGGNAPHAREAGEADDRLTELL
jgi:uncharacterized delta-60 repeat protein